VRIEDLDTPRVIPGCAAEMLHTLEAFGLHWDGEVEYQSRRTHRYAAALNSLRATGRTFECSCSRRELASETGYPGTCRNAPTRRGPTATRFRVEDSATESWLDRVQGPCQFELHALGDPVVRRRDGAFAYQLAVVVDDAAQGVSDVVRGADLLQSTGWQIHLQRALGLKIPRFAHLPIVMDTELGKLAKSRGSLALDPANTGSQLVEALRVLQQNVPAELQHAPPGELLAWATSHWSLDPVQGRNEVVVSRRMSHV
jgi:glutamyl-Q tRNA(Asp) synthetase